MRPAGDRRSTRRSAPTSGRGSASTRRSAPPSTSRMVDGYESRARAACRGRLAWRRDDRRVGGGNGSLLVEFLRARPGQRGIVFDLPETVRDGRPRRPDRVRRRQLLRARACRRGVRPLDDPARLGRRERYRHPPDDRRVRTARARLVILDGVVAAGNEPDGTKWLDLLMLTLLGGRERSESQWRALLGGAGMEATSIQDGLIEAQWPLTVGTAGHIDHGKTWLVRALTGKDTDRLPEEQERGISIDSRLRAARAARRTPALASSTSPATSASCARWWPARPGSTSSCS